MKTMINSQQLQYKIALKRSGLEPILTNDTANVAPATAMRQLEEYNWRWNSLTPIQTSTIAVNETCYAYELVDGFFVKTMPSRLTTHREASRRMTIIELPTAERPHSITTFEDLGCEIRDFAIDPGQDLLILLEHEEM